MFRYSVEGHFAHPVAVEDDAARVEVWFRHFAPQAVTFGDCHGGTVYNVAFRLYRNGHLDPAFEDRGVVLRTPAEPDEWIPASLVIPRQLIEFGASHELFVDLVAEGEYWFSDRTNAGLREAINFIDTRQERHAAIADLQADALENMLSKAYARIVELEHAERALIAERDEYRARFESLRERIGKDWRNRSMAPPEAERAAALLQSLDVVKRRDHWLDHISRLRLQGDIFSVFPHDGLPGRYQILICGSGGYGDLLYITPVVRELFACFAEPVIIVVHEHPNAASVYDSSPYITGVISLKQDSLRDFLHLAHTLDVFDLVVDIRYAVTYSAPPMSRIPADFLRRATYSAAEWQRYVRYTWPRMNNLFANRVTARGLTKLDLMGLTSLLPIDRFSPLDLFVPGPAPLQASELIGTRYVTVHHGADRNLLAGRAAQTKNLPLDLWAEIVLALSGAGFTVVQLGEDHEHRIAHVDVDFLGKTSLTETAAIIKTAMVHIDTEGGLVHVARAVHTPSVVMFGPTTAQFFGYPQNINIPPKACGNCWWTTDTWAHECPRQLAAPECMALHDASEVAAAAGRLADSRRPARLLDFVDASEAPLEHVAARLRPLLSQTPGEGIVLFGRTATGRPAGSLPRWLEDAPRLVHADQFQEACGKSGERSRVIAYSAGNIPINTGTLPWALAIGIDVRNPGGVALCLDVLRCVKAGGLCLIIATNHGEALGQRTWLADMLGAAGQLPGLAYQLTSDGTALAVPDQPATAMLLELATVPAAGAQPDLRLSAAPVGNARLEPASDAVSIEAALLPAIVDHPIAALPDMVTTDMSLIEMPYAGPGE